MGALELTAKQQQAVDLEREGKSQREIAKIMKICPRAAFNHLKAARKKARDVGADPGFMVTGKSTMYGPDGETKLEWVKTSQEHQAIEDALRAAVDAMTESLPREPAIKGPKRKLDAELLNCFIVTDYHLGMYGWPEETGDDEWNTELAETTLVKWFESAIKRSPNAETAVLANIGDFLHWDGLEAVTPTSKHVLDADTRFQLIVRVAIRVFRRIVRMLLKKHAAVHVIMADANHDPAGEAWLRELFAALYADEPRVTVDTSADTYYCFEHGDTALFFHHGHKRKVTNVDDVFVSKFREIYGRTKHAYAHMGHLHHIDVKETNLMIVHQHRTLAAKDAYASRGGWLSGRSADCITYHDEFGEVGRVTVSYEMTKAA